MQPFPGTSYIPANEGRAGADESWRSDRCLLIRAAKPALLLTELWGVISGVLVWLCNC